MDTIALLTANDKSIRSWEDVNCEHAFECFNGCRYGKGCYEDGLNSAMGGKPWQECYCMTDLERRKYNMQIDNKGL